MSARGRRTPRDRRRRTHGQNFLASAEVVTDLIGRVEISPGETVVEIGAGRGALTIPLARAGAHVLAIERDREWARRLAGTAKEQRLDGRVEVVARDFRSVALPTGPYRVVASPPFNLTTALLARLLDDPDRGPRRADLVLQSNVARKRAEDPPTTLRSAAWAPWWSFEYRTTIPRTAFRPVPRVDAALLTIRRREAPVLPAWLAPDLRDLLRPGWDPPER